MKSRSEELAGKRAEFFPYEIGYGFSVKASSPEECAAFAAAYHGQIFLGEDKSIRRFFNPTADRRQQIKSMVEMHRKGHYEWFVFLNPEKDTIGWHMGRVEDEITFCLGVTAILPAYQNKGLYRDFARRLEAYLAAVGYERISSHHTPTNRGLLIHKLKTGFTFTGMELTERWGPVIKMVKLLPEDRRGSFYSLYGTRHHLS